MFFDLRGWCAWALTQREQAEEEGPAGLSSVELRATLVELGGRMASLESRFLAMLDEFDRREGWRADGQLSGVDWLVWRCGLAARTARDKLRVARELRRRPALAAAFSSGLVSYCAVRAITRVEGAGTDTDEKLLALAESGTVRDLERVVAHWEALCDQERGVQDYLARFERRRFRASRTFDGMELIEVVLAAEEGEEARALLDSAMAAGPVDGGSREPASSAAEEPVDGGSREPASFAQRRADAFMDLLRAGAAALREEAGLPSSERYTLNAVVDVDLLTGRFGGRAELIDGTPLSLETLRRYACDAELVRHVLRGASIPLEVGARTRVWNRAQRRAIALRDHGRCRFPGCWRRVADVHHVRHYVDGGPTDVSNGCLLCPRHHTCVHEGGFRIRGDANGTLYFSRRDGTLLGTS